MTKKLKKNITVAYNNLKNETTPINEKILNRHQEEIQGEKALWKAVITQALMDAGSNSSKKEAKYDRAKAISWLSGKSKDFLTVCTLADLEPQYVIEKTREAIGRGCKWRKDLTNIKKADSEENKNKKGNVVFLANFNKNKLSKN